MLCSFDTVLFLICTITQHSMDLWLDNYANVLMIVSSVIMFCVVLWNDYGVYGYIMFNNIAPNISKFQILWKYVLLVISKHVSSEAKIALLNCILYP